MMPHRELCLIRAYQPLSDSRHDHAVLGLSIVGDEAAGAGTREGDDRITRNASCFVPHYFD